MKVLVYWAHELCIFLHIFRQVVKELALKDGVSVSKGGASAADPDDDLDPSTMDVKSLQSELSKRGLDAKWNPMVKGGKKVLVDRLQASHSRA